MIEEAESYEFENVNLLTVRYNHKFYTPGSLISITIKQILYYNNRLANFKTNFEYSKIYNRR